MTTSTEQMRAWTGPAILTYGFRPFGAGVWAALAMVLWVPMLSGDLTLPAAFDPVSWHAHEFLFGYLGAVIAIPADRSAELDRTAADCRLATGRAVCPVVDRTGGGGGVAVSAAAWRGPG